MSASWYYAQKNHNNTLDTKGPISEEQLAVEVSQNVLTPESYVWTKGMANWKKIQDVPELSGILVQLHGNDAPPIMPQVESFDWNNINPNEKKFHIRIGLDRGCSDTEYGPYSINQLKKAFEENRINGKTFIFAPGMDNWVFLADIPLFQEIFHQNPPVIEERERRTSIRRPFVAKLFFHNEKKVYEGICRDISIGGLQILVADYPAQIGDKISLNVHPDNSAHCFTADGIIVRTLIGNQGLCIRFLDLNSHAQDAIKTYLAQIN